MTTADTVRPTLILVPGLLCDDTIWNAQVAAFAATHEVIVPMLDGFDAIPRMAAALLERAPARFALAGHSLGGRIALEVVRREPWRVTRLALLDTGVHPCTTGEPARRQELLSIAFAEGMHAVARRWLPPMVHPDRHSDPSVMGPLEQMVERRTAVSFRNQVEALLGRPDARAVLATIRCPTLVLCGREDGWSPLEQHQRIAAAIGGSTLAVIDACGHMAPFERPREVSRAFERWLG